MAVNDLYDALVEFFEACKAALALTDAGVPECAYLNEGPPAWDACPCLIVWAGAPAVGDTLPLQPSLQPMHRIQEGRMLNLVPMTAVALRCQAIMDESGQLPQPADHLGPTKEILQDAWALWNYLASANRAGQLFPPTVEGGKREFSLEPGIAYNPQGAAAGSAITCRVQLDGYDAL